MGVLITSNWDNQILCPDYFYSHGCPEEKFFNIQEKKKKTSYLIAVGQSCHVSPIPTAV